MADLGNSGMLNLGIEEQWLGVTGVTPRLPPQAYNLLSLRKLSQKADVSEDKDADGGEQR